MPGPALHALAVGSGPLVLNMAACRAFISEANGSVTLFAPAFDLERGPLIQRIPVGPAAFSYRGIAIDHRTARVFVAEGDDAHSAGVVAVLAARTGAVVRVLSPGIRPGAVAVSERLRRAYLLNAGDVEDGRAGSVAILDAMTGRLIRTITVGLHPRHIAVDDVHSRVVVLNDGDSSSGEQGVSSVSTIDARTAALVHTETLGPGSDIGSGTVTAPPGEDTEGLAADDGAGRVFVQAATMGLTPTITALDAVTGTTAYTVAAPLAGEGSGWVVLPRSHRLIVARLTTVSGGPAAEPELERLDLQVYDTRTGHLEEKVFGGEYPEVLGIHLAVDERDNHLVAAWRVTGGGHITVIDLGHGTYIGDIDVSYHPTAIAIDERTHRAFVAYLDNINQYGDPTGPGAVALVDVEHGQDLATLRVGVGPWTIAFDQATGTALVGDADGTVYIYDEQAPARPGPHTTTPASPVPARCCGVRYFARTHHTLSGAFRAFWQRYGGIDTFGYPRTEPFIEGGRLVQYTDRFLLEIVNGRVETGPLGRDFTAGRLFAPVDASSLPADVLYVGTTRHTVSGPFLAYWRAHAGATLLGAPLSEVITEGNNDSSGRRYRLQWFEKGRLEYHAELAHTRYAMQLGLLGLQALKDRGWVQGRMQGGRVGSRSAPRGR